MIITLDLSPEIEQGLLAQARSKGLSLSDYLQQIVEREAHAAPVHETPPASVPQARNLVELFENSPFRGLDMQFERDRDYGRDIEF